MPRGKNTPPSKSESKFQPASEPLDSTIRPPIAIVGIGASAGGIEAFIALLEALPTNTGLAFVFIQHLAPSHVSLLADILGRVTTMHVIEVSDEAQILADHLYVIPPGRIMSVRGGVLHLADAEGTQNRAIDFFFSSLADDLGYRAIGVVLSGTATDGTLGLEAIKASGGITFAQDGTAQHDGMPRSASSSGCVDFIMPPAQIAAELVALSTHFSKGARSPNPYPMPSDEFQEVLQVLREESGVDFSQYKSNTLHRRIRRRMALHRLPTLNDYAQYLRSNAKEIESLYQDILIGVTSFFRDPDAFSALRQKVFPALFQDRSRHDAVRIWVLGCATGEECYSLAIALKEYTTEVNSQAQFIIYATDLNNISIEKSRNGVYPKSIEADLTPERLRRFFVEAEGGYRITKAIRDLCVFARQNVLTDPPFSRMDLISCRNVLIYMEPALQKKLMPVLQYALKPKGYLFLGPSESLGGQGDSYEVVSNRHKIFRRKAAPGRTDVAIPPLPSTYRAEARPVERWTEARPDVRLDVQRDADRALLSRYVPPGVLVNNELEIVQFRGDTGLYFTPAPGRATLNVLKMARHGLLVPLRAALQRAMKENSAQYQEGLKIKSNGGFREIALTVIPVPSGHSQTCYWVLFESLADSHRPATKQAPASKARARRNAPSELRDRDEHIAQLTQELAATREYLQSVIEQQEAANEQLQSANEEVQSANEELQSINEELETSKEEIQSSNEELTTVNEELQNRNTELNGVNNDLNNLFGSVQMAMVMVWRDLKIRRFTPLAEKLFNLIAGDVGRPISDIKLKIDVGDLPRLLEEVIESAAIREIDVQGPDGHWYQLRLRPYRTFEKQIDGAVIMLIDIDTLKRNQEAIARQAALLEHSTDAIFVHDVSGVIQYWNRGAEVLYGIPRSDACGKRVQQLLSIDVGHVHVTRQQLAERGQWRGELVHHKSDGTSLAVAAHQIPFEEAGRSLVLETHHDITERKRLEDTLQQRVRELALADKSKNDFLVMLAHELQNPLAPLRNAVQILKAAPHDDELNERTLALIDRQVTNMVRMVDDLLDAARLSRGRIDLQFEKHELQAIIARSVEAVRPMIESKEHRLTLLMPPSAVLVNADATRLEQIFSNLLNNASKYTERGGEITLTVVVTVPDFLSQRPEVAIRIRDNGVGIAPDMLPRVFDLFAQADHSLARTQGGLGIGLNIVRNLVELHGGRVSAHSPGLHLGSEFVVILPTDSGATSERPAAGSQAGSEPSTSKVPKATAVSNGGRRVLVVDDSPDIAESTATLLSLQGYSVVVAGNGEQALAAASQFHPEVVLMDLGMPGLDGYAVARRMRAAKALRNVLLIAVSGYGTEEDRRRAREAGFDHHVVKPLDFDTLQSVIGKRH